MNEYDEDNFDPIVYMMNLAYGTSARIIRKDDTHVYIDTEDYLDRVVESVKATPPPVMEPAKPEPIEVKRRRIKI